MTYRPYAAMNLSVILPNGDCWRNYCPAKPAITEIILTQRQPNLSTQPFLCVLCTPQRWGRKYAIVKLPVSSSGVHWQEHVIIRKLTAHMEPKLSTRGWRSHPMEIWWTGCALLVQGGVLIEINFQIARKRQTAT